jgi:predicted RNA binding protein YcfA (HicA-like mRNA interferase family)
MAFSGSVWSQLKNTTADEIISALKRDGWKLEPDCKGAIQIYRHPDTRRVGIHYHPKKTFPPLLSSIFHSPTASGVADMMDRYNQYLGDPGAQIF